MELFNLGKKFIKSKKNKLFIDFSFHC